MSFDFENFTQEVYEQFNESLSLEKVRDLLNLDDEYNLDIQKANAKRLVLREVNFIGTKSNGDSIDFSCEIFSGINMWIADNFKGKSSLFKIIQFALTGNNKIKKDIKKWLKEILLNFDVDSKSYAVYLNLEKSALSAKFYETKVSSIEEVKQSADAPLFEAKNVDEYTKQIQQFFFDQFSYYSMQWTQKSSKKDSDELLEANASWTTYFKSIYLESKDSDKLAFGDQGKKVFQMLLGLELTYPINRLKVKKDKLENQTAKQRTTTEISENGKNSEKNNLEKELREIETRLKNLDSQNNEKLNVSNLFAEHKQISDKLSIEISKATSIGTRRQKNDKKTAELKSKKDSIQNELTRISREFNSIERRIADYKEYLEIGSFFSNLDIKHCPSCNHSVSENKNKILSADKKCFLCHDSVKEDNNQINQESYLAKTEELKLESERLKKRKQELIISLEITQKEYDEAVSYSEVLEKELQEVGETAQLNQKLIEIENKINKEKENPQLPNAEREKFIEERAILSYRLKQLITPIVKQNNTLAIEIELLDFAINRLSEYRYQLSENTLKRLSELMISEIQEFGLKSFTRVEITDNFDIKYEQDGDLIEFSEIAEGEQLRAKLAFYLSLIQLEIEQNIGRHTKLLIIDSPAKEEGDATYLEGLSDVLKNIEKRFSDKLQILIGTAERNLAGVAVNQHTVPKEEYLF